MSVRIGNDSSDRVTAMEEILDRLLLADRDLLQISTAGLSRPLVMGNSNDRGIALLRPQHQDS